MPLLGNSNFLQALGWAVLNSLWQMAFCWVIFQVILSLGIKRPALKSSLAMLFLSAGFTWFLITFFSHWVIDPAAAKRSLFSIGNFEAAGADDWNQRMQFVLPYASAAYLLLLAVPLWQFMRNYRFVQIIRTQGLSKCNVDLRLFVQRYSERMNIAKAVHVHISDLISSPVTIGFIKPIILMPMAAITCLSMKQVEAILLHELAHIRRYDYLSNLVINFIRTILYFNPFVKLFAKTIERERERSCDEMVIQFQYDRHGYASALLLLEQNNRMHQSMVVAAAGKKQDLLHRVEKIMGVERKAQVDLRKLTGLLAGLLCIIALNALFLIGQPVIKDSALSFNSFANPFYHVVSDGQESSTTTPLNSAQPRKQQLATAKKKVKPEEQAVTLSETAPAFIPDAPSSPFPVGFQHAGERVDVMPVLDHLQEVQVKRAVEATKKIVEQGQWKQVEDEVADAMTQAEKENLKAKYYSQAEKVNWNQLENKLKLSYDDINWETVNNKLSSAITSFKIDSVKMACNVALSEIVKAETWMEENKSTSIPDTDVKLEAVKGMKLKLQGQLKVINEIKRKKIIHL
jgi:beta-lactamase regulating signal transducer with metallopeptidase domain